MDMWLKGRFGFGNKILLAAGFMLLFSISGCDHASMETTEVTETESKVQIAEQKDKTDEEKIINCCLELYKKAAEEDKLDDLDTIRGIAAQLGVNGYPAVDSKNQVDMVEAAQVEQFCEIVEARDNAQLTVIRIMDSGGLITYNLNTADGNVDVVRSYYRYQNGNLKKEEEGSYRAENWRYTEEGYLMFSGTWDSKEMFALTLSDAEEYAALRVKPLDETCRELNRKYLLPIGFAENNMFLVDWSEENFGELDFYDMYDILYPLNHSDPMPFVKTDEGNNSAVCRISKEDFEDVIMTYFKIDSETLQSKTTYDPETMTYEYRPRGIYEVEYPEYPYSEVVDFTENGDGTLTLTSSVVFPYAGDSNVYTHEVTVRQLADGGVQYVSNRILSEEKSQGAVWHTGRLPENEWKEMYGE